MVRVALIVGVPRSGTSILGEIVAVHPDVRYRFERTDLWGLPGTEHHRLTASQATPAWIDLITRALHASAPDGRMYVGKQPRCILRLPFIKAAVPNVKIVHVIRDGRDVACSMVPGGLRHLRTPRWREHAAKHRGAELYARIWQEAIEIALTDLISIDHLQVRYEDLVRDAAAQAARLLDYLELSWHPAVEAHCALVSDATEGSYHARYQDAWYMPDHRRRVGRYRENLTPEQIASLTALLAPTLTKLGYAV